MHVIASEARQQVDILLPLALQGVKN